MVSLIKYFIPEIMTKGITSKERRLRYHHQWAYLVLLISLVALIPLFILAVLVLDQYKSAYRQESINYVSELTSNTQQDLENFITEHENALMFVAKDLSFAELTDPEYLAQTLANLEQTFGRFVDLGVVDPEGEQLAYAGPYSQAPDKNYREQPWFEEAASRSVYVSEVTPGIQRSPHFVIAVRQNQPDDSFFILRATIDTKTLDSLIRLLELHEESDAFIINQQGILQSHSNAHGKLLEQCTFPNILSEVADEPIQEIDNEQGQSVIVGRVQVADSPFIFVLIESEENWREDWKKIRNKVLFFLVVSTVLVLMVALWSATYMVNRLRKADLQQAAFFTNVEYTNKMASVGRLAAGVAHEINNPMAIINEKAGLLKDMVTFHEDFNYQEKTLEIVKAILKSVHRCSTITHRLLGFAKRVDVLIEPIDLEALLREVLSYLAKEAHYRNMAIFFHVDHNMPAVESDSGQLQQVFLNIISNAFAAMRDGGRLDIYLKDLDGVRAEVTIRDNGDGISEENMEHIFEPFFTTKKQYGTGLGLSITYGVVQKLGGEIKAKSKVGDGATFIVTLPVKQQKEAISNE